MPLVYLLLVLVHCYDVLKVRAMIELTQEQHKALTQNGPEPAHVIDRATSVEYVLVRAEVYERLKALLDNDLPDTAAVMNEVMADDDAKDPYLESYQHYAREAP